MDSVILRALTAAFNPTLLGATTVMLLLDRPKRLLLGYLLGAMMTSLTLGMVIVFSLDGSSGATSTAQSTLSPATDLALGGLLLVVAYMIRPGRTPVRPGASPSGGEDAPRPRRRARKGRPAGSSL